MTKKLTDPSELQPYLDSGWQLIPLHRYGYFDEYKGKKRQRGKSPLHAKWTTMAYNSRDQVAHMKDGGNVGVRLRASDLVVDVDPRNFKEGDDPWRRLCDDCGLDPDDYPTVETGGGGLHLYMVKPDDVSIRDSLPDYEGVEFKTIGRQVVAAGSIHPDTRRVYVWDFLKPLLTDPPTAPDRLINLVRRPSSTAATGGGEYTQEEVATMLDALDPCDFSDHDNWFTLMQACHHASGGDARQEFIEWSTRDPDYSDEAGIIGRRWDSLHADVDGARVTYRTLHKLMLDADQGDAIPRMPPEDDFEDDLPQATTEVGVPDHERKGPLEGLNGKFWAVMDGGKFRVYMRQVDPTTNPPREHWVVMTRADFENFLANRRVQKGDSVVPLAKAWIEWAGRRSAEGVIFDPMRDHPNFLNLWTGWGVEPKRGDWSLLDELLRDVLCDGDDAVYRYVLDWAAHMVQRPDLPAETAICFQGDRGVGKSTWGRALCSIAGARHGMHITSSEQLTGRFNSHLRDCILMFADEAVKPYDKEAESRLKALITEPTLAFEAKGKDLVTGRNMIHVVMASNDEWFVPMGLQGERRFVLQRANNLRQGDMAFFKALNRQLENGGLQGLLWDLLNREIKDWHPRGDLPGTVAALEQKLRGMAPSASWWFNLLMEGDPPGQPVENVRWAEGPVAVFKQDVRDHFQEHCRASGIRAGSNSRHIDMMFAKEILNLCGSKMRSRVRIVVPDDRPDVKSHSDGRAWAYEFPDLATCRKHMEGLLGGSPGWAADERDPLES